MRGTGTPKDRDKVNRLLVTSTGNPIRFRIKTMNLCLCDSEERERGVGAGVNVTILFLTLQVVCVYYKSMK